jgi:CRISPR-associated protein Csd1
VSWIQKLQKTYDRCAGQPQFDEAPLPPISARPLDTQICITLDWKGGFRNAELALLRGTQIIESEASASRSGTSPAANPLSDKLSYCAGDGSKFGLNPDYFTRFETQLSEWCSSEFRDPKACVVLEYVKQKRLIADLIQNRILTSSNGGLDRVKLNGKMVKPSEAWIRWRVELRDEMLANTWEDTETFVRWERFETSKSDATSLCMSSGVTERIARLHPSNIRRIGDRAKLISSNDKEGYTFRGRFTNSRQCASLSYIVSQKAHSALRWLIARQGYPNGDQRIVAWAVSGNAIPKVIAGSDEIETVELPERYGGDVGQLFAKQLNKRIAGYQANLTDREEIVVLALDSATKVIRRLAITYYRELKASEFLERIQSWHEHTAWPQNMGKDPKSGVLRKFIGAPSPHDIAEAAHGRKVNGRINVDDKLLKATIERLLPCIVEARPIPDDLVRICVQRACNRLTMNGPDFWEKCLGIACALVRGSSKEEQYTMSLDETRTTRDYLYGRLLAIADNIEGLALRVANESRDTNAAQLMQRFADNPFTTWRILEFKLRPYMTRLRSSRAGALNIREQLLDNVMGLFRVDVHGVSEFTDNSKLSGEVLLGYHNQRAALIPKKPNKDGVVSEPESNLNEEEEL